MDKKENGAEEIYLAPEKEKAPKNTGAEKEFELQDQKNVKGAHTVPFMEKEIPEMRKGNKKVFQMNDGTEKAVFYPEPLHVYDEATKTYQNIDNTLTEETDGRHFRNGANHFTARFSKEDNDELFSVEKKEHKIKVYAGKQNKKQNHGCVPKLGKKKLNDRNKTEKDVLCFVNAINDCDLEYSVTGSGVKENIVIFEKADVYQYSFMIEYDNLTVDHQATENIILFKDSETAETVFFIPVPFMTDANGVVSTAVRYETEEIADGKLALTVIADNDWINDKDRAFPVMIDPQIKVSGESNLATYTWDNGVLYQGTFNMVGTTSLGSEMCYGGIRTYIHFTMPVLPRNPRIKKAELIFKQSSGSVSTSIAPNIGLYRVDSGMVAGTCTPIHDSNLIDFVKIKEGDSSADIEYSFDITTLVDQANKGEFTTQNLVLKAIDESVSTDDNVFLYASASENGENMPKLVITYESSYGVNTSYRTHAHELGRFGQGSIDLQCGNLMFESEDFAWAGNRMPVTLKHLYNSALGNYQYTQNASIKLNTANFSAMKLGYGWKLNLMQSMKAATFLHENTSYSGYIYTDENGEEIYFKPKTDANGTVIANMYEDVNGSEMSYNKADYTLTVGSDTYLFDSIGRLSQIVDEYGNMIWLFYSSNRISSIEDGAGREFFFAYNSSGFLTSITAPDNTAITYTYTGNLLTSITYPDGKKALITYSSNKPSSVTLKDASGKTVYKVAYTFNGNRLTSVTEYGTDENGTLVTGTRSEYDYSIASGRTVVETIEPDQTAIDPANKSVYCFDDDGNIISEYAYSQDIGNVGVTCGGSGINPLSNAEYTSNINNLLTQHNFETRTAWIAEPGNRTDTVISTLSSETDAKFGKTALRMQSVNAACAENGVYQQTETLPAGDYTFSAYIRVVTAFSGEGAYLLVTDEVGEVLTRSEKLCYADSEYVRLNTSFTLDVEQSVQVHILMDGKGTVNVDGAQLENNPFVNPYNMLENGNFERGVDVGWSRTDGTATSTVTRFNMEKALKMSGDLELIRTVFQDITVKSDIGTRESFTLSGWALGYGLPNHEREDAETPLFELRAEMFYTDGTKLITTAPFSPCTEEWQFASVQFEKDVYKSVSFVRVFCDYSNNFGNAFFDDIQLVRNSIETGLTSDDFKTASDDSSSSGDTTQTETFTEAVDAYGNPITETTFTEDKIGTIYRSFAYNTDDEELSGYNDGNDLIRETDARGNMTYYTVDGATSRNEEITDRCGNKTTYEYDVEGKTTKVTSKNASGTTLASVSYAYDGFNNMTEIARGDGLKYVLAYNDFHNLESIGINGKSEKLITYTYKNGNGRLKQMTYANGDTMKATYNSFGQMVAETWYNANNVEKARYKYTYDGNGNLNRSIDIYAKKEYNYEYEDGKILRAVENNITLNDCEIVTGRTLVNTVRYYYDTNGQLTKKVITPAGGMAFTYTYTNAENTDTTVQFTAGGQTVTSSSQTDSLGRKTLDKLEFGTESISRQFSYHAGKETSEHCNYNKLQDDPTTLLVSKIVFSNGRTLSYQYDAEERITKVVDSDDATIVYTYDALGQLLTEKVNGTVVNSMTYDNYGNILTKNGKSYTYDSTWKDLLTSYNGQSITYDAQGNPTTYLGHTLTWEKGRQLKSFDSNTYTYNANGIRTSKTVNGVKHTYTLDGTKILRETWGSNTLIPLYDNEETVCGIIYNNVPYYFLKNLQGDIIAITDNTGTIVTEYLYDAWGNFRAIYDCSDDNIGNINPYRYRGYYYDAEIGMYYLQSRYYDSRVSRFLNSDDSEVTTHSYKFQNAYVYCANNGIVAFDTLGYFPVHLVVGTVAGFIWGIAPRLLKMILFKQRAKLSDILCDGLAGAVGGLITAATGNSTLGTFLGTFIGEVVRYFVQERPFSSGTSFLNILINIFVCLVMAGIAALASFVAGKLVNKITKKSFSSKQIKQYLKQTKKLKSALGIGTNGRTARRMWYMDCGITTALSTGLNTMIDFIKEFLRKVMS